MHTVFALLCFVVVIHWLILSYPSGLLHWHCGNLTIAPVPAKQSWWIWINTSYEFIMNDCITTTKQSTTKPCAYFLGYTVAELYTACHWWSVILFCTGEGGCIHLGAVNHQTWDVPALFLPSLHTWRIYKRVLVRLHTHTHTHTPPHITPNPHPHPPPHKPKPTSRFLLQRLY